MTGASTDEVRVALELIEEDGWHLVATRGSHCGFARVRRAGDSIKAVEQDIRDAIRFHIDGLKEDGPPVPVPIARAKYVDT